MSQKKTVYLISLYPGISHTFILREIRRLRALGMVIKTASINPPDRARGELDADEMEEADQTFYIKKEGFFRAVLACLALCLKPMRLLSALKMIFLLAGWDVLRIFKHFAYFGEALLLGKWMASQGIAHAHVHFANPASTVALLAANAYDISFSMTIHGPDEFYDVTLNSLPQKIAKASFIICISHYAQSQLMRITPMEQWDKLHVVRLGVDADVFSPYFQPLREEPCQILCVGRLVPSKGQLVLIQAFEKLIRKGKNIYLHIVGGGPDKKILEEEAISRNLQKKIHFTGPVNPGEISEYYQFADIMALPSFAEGLPVVLMEAMAMEVPCIASCINGVPELIRHGVDGLLIAPSDVDQLAQTLELLVDDPDFRRKLGRAGRERILDKYLLEKNIDILYLHFKNLLPARSKDA